MPTKEQPSTEITFEELYLQQRKKSQMLLIAVIVLAVATAGSLAWGASKTSSQPQMPGGFPSGQQGFGNGQGGPGGMRGGMGMMNVKQFFKDDGSVDTSEVKSFMERMPSRRNMPSGSNVNFLDRFKENINQAAKDGDITQEQASKLIEALEAQGSSSNES